MNLIVLLSIATIYKNINKKLFEIFKYQQSISKIYQLGQLKKIRRCKMYKNIFSFVVVTGFDRGPVLQVLISLYALIICSYCAGEIFDLKEYFIVLVHFLYGTLFE